MQFIAKARYVRCSPYKLRGLVDAIRKKNVKYVMAFLQTCSLKRAVPIQKLIKSAAANAKNLQNIEPDGLIIKDIRVDQGPIFKYFKPSAMGRSSPQRKRLCHLSVALEPIQLLEQKEA